MKTNITVHAEKREVHSSNLTRKLRREGFLPAVVYGQNENYSIKLVKHDFDKIFYKIGEHTIIKLNLNYDDEVKEFDVLIKDYQIDPVRKHLIHLDFIRVYEDRPVKTKIPLRIIGSAKGVKVGGILEQFITEIKIKTLPKYIPHFFEVDVSELDVAQSIKIREMEVPEHIEILNPADQTIVGVVVSRTTKMGEEEDEEGATTEEAETNTAADTTEKK